MVVDLGARSRQLHRLVHLGLPEFVRHIRTLDSQRATTILHRCPTARAFEAGCISELASLRCDARGRVVGEALARDLVAAARMSIARFHGPAYQGQIRRVCDVDALRVRNAELTKEITAFVSIHPLGDLLASIDGLGPVTIARILAAVGDPARFRSTGAFASYVGVVPGIKESGAFRSRHAHISPPGNARLRRALYMTTLSALHANPWLRTHYQRLRSNAAEGRPSCCDAETPRRDLHGGQEPAPLYILLRRWYPTAERRERSPQGLARPRRVGSRRRAVGAGAPKGRRRLRVDACHVDEVPAPLRVHQEAASVLAQTAHDRARWSTIEW